MATKVKKKKKSKSSVVVNVSNCRYDVIRDVALKHKWKVLEDCDDDDEDMQDAWNIYWTDTSVSTERVMKLRQYQRLNHFPGMHQLARKGSLGKNLSRLQARFPTQFKFFPQTWVLPAQWQQFKQHVNSGKGNRTYIIKPDAACQGKGIFLTRSVESVNPRASQVAQKYLHKPLLIDGYKFDVRLYVLITSIDPLRIYLYHNGLVRICTEKYVEPTRKNLSKVCMHLTNYSINKGSDNFVFNKSETDNGVGNKRSLIWFWDYLKDKGHNVDSLLDCIHDMIVKTLISVQPCLKHIYNSCRPGAGKPEVASNCFELLGFDVMIDRKLQPWLIEVNHSPSFFLDTPLDKSVKEDLIDRTFHMLNVSKHDKRRVKQQEQNEAQNRLYSAKFHGNDESEEALPKPVKNAKEERHKWEKKQTADGYFRQIYPPDETALNSQHTYDRLLEVSEELYESSVKGGANPSYSAQGLTNAKLRQSLKQKQLHENRLRIAQRFMEEEKDSEDRIAYTNDVDSKESRMPKVGEKTSFQIAMQNKHLGTAIRASGNKSKYQIHRESRTKSQGSNTFARVTPTIKVTKVNIQNSKTKATYWVKSGMKSTVKYSHRRRLTPSDLNCRMAEDLEKTKQRGIYRKQLFSRYSKTPDVGAKRPVSRGNYSTYSI